MNNEHCTTPNRPILAAVDGVDKLVIMFRPRCKLWSCPYCAEQNKRLWTLRAHFGAETILSEGVELKFVTLTSHEKLTARETYYVWPLAWKKLSTRLSRKQGAGHRYFMVPEQHEDGRLHMHAVATWTISQTWLKDNARSSGLGYMQDIQEVDNPQFAAAYVSKYLGKQLTLLEWPKGFRHVRVSRAWPKPLLPDITRWRFETIGQEEAEQRANRYRDSGCSVLMLRHDIAWGIVQEFEERTLPD